MAAPEAAATERWPKGSPAAGCTALLQIRYGHSVDIRRAAAQRALAGLLGPPRRAGGEEAMDPPARAADRARIQAPFLYRGCGPAVVAGSPHAPHTEPRADEVSAPSSTRAFRRAA